MILKNGKEISKRNQPYIVAELNSSHRGKVSIAKEMIDAAKACGCDAVKFQSWSAGSLYCKDYYDLNPMSKRMVSSFSLKPESLLELASYCNEVCIDFSSTPYSNAEVDFLVEQCNIPFIKISSMDIDNIPFLRYIAKKSVPIVLSTGMASIDEISLAVKTIAEEGNTDICILHCVSVYPVDINQVNLNNMVMLEKMFPGFEIGYSDHTIGSEAACASVALGAALIEKHFTLDNKKIGWDNQMAAEPVDMGELVENCHKTYCSLGLYERSVSLDELKQRKKMRRSLVAAADLAEGHILTEADINAKRPGDGIPVRDYEMVVGRALACSVVKDQMLKLSMLK